MWRGEALKDSKKKRQTTTGTGVKIKRREKDGGHYVSKANPMVASATLDFDVSLRRRPSRPVVVTAALFISL